ncbi:MAG TPA: transglutaminase domain-containing protein [Vicinamibacterales bacterium]|nr:transglutaminase domain-containing protein [Vicinamibacterales bacterium]
MATAAWHRVDDSLTTEDVQYIPRFLAGIPAIGAASARQYGDEVQFIGRVQEAVLRIAPLNEGIPKDSPREPRDVFEAHRGLCYDRSRAIEKILRYSGFETRHIALYAIAPNGSALHALLASGTPSHAITEVRTQRGWLVVDSNNPWLSLDSSNLPVSMTRIRDAARGAAHLAWRTPPPNEIYQHPFTFVYGLYSRNGHFYPPYDFIPDVAYGELIDNLS